jgi:hypothetical protein
MNWGHVVVLLLAAAAVMVSLVTSALINQPRWMSFHRQRPGLPRPWSSSIAAAALPLTPIFIRHRDRPQHPLAADGMAT